MNFNFILLPADPLRDADLSSLRLLAGYLVCHYRRGADGTRWLDACLPAAGPPCRAVARLVVLARGSTAVRRELDRWFDRELGAAAADLELLSPFELAAYWAHARGRLRGRPLAALLWMVARRNDPAGRHLADRIASTLESRDLVPGGSFLDPHPFPAKEAAHV